MSNRFFGFGSKAPFGSNKTDEFLTDDVEEEEEYDALNDETFGDGALDGDWENDHEKMAGFMRPGRRHPPVEVAYESKYFQEDIEDDFDEKLGGSKEIVEQTISNLGLEDDIDDPAVMKSGKSAFSPRPLDVLFGPSAPPPAILDAEKCGSPKTRSIWSTSATLLSTPSKENQLTSLLQNLKVQSINDPYQKSLHESPHFIGSSLASKSPTLISSAHKLEDIERDLLGKGTDFPSRSSWSSSPKTVTAEQVEKELLSTKSLWAPQTSQHQRDPKVHHWTSSTPPIPISGKVRTLDDVEGDILLRPRAHTLDDVERSMQRNTGPLPGYFTPSSRLIGGNRQPPIGTPPQGGAAFPMTSANQPISSSPISIMPLTGRTSPSVVPSPIGSQMSTSLPPHPILNPGRTLGHNAFGNFNRNPYPFNVQGAPLLNIQGTADLRRLFYPRQIHHPLLNLQNYPPRGGWNPSWNANQRRDVLNHGYRDPDEYKGIMTQREKEWLIKIQMLQLHTDNPYVDDYYHTTYIMRKMTRERSKSLCEDVNDSDEDNEVKLVVPERSKQESRTYVPLQFEGSLGKLQAVSVNFPRRILDVHHMSTEEESRMPANKELHKQRRLLLDIEKLYTVFLNVDDEEKRILALPEDAQASHKENRKLLIEKLFVGLCCNNEKEKFVQLATIRKGRHLIMRSITLFSREQQIAIYSALYGNIGYIARRDQVDQVLPQYLNMAKKMISQCSFEELVTLGSSLQGDSDKPLRNNYLAALQTKFVLSSLCNMINKAEQIIAKEEFPVRNDLQSSWTNFVLYIVDALCAIKENSLKPPDAPPINILRHIQRYPVAEDQLETLKTKLKPFGFN